MGGKPCCRARTGQVRAASNCAQRSSNSDSETGPFFNGPSTISSFLVRVAIACGKTEGRGTSILPDQTFNSGAEGVDQSDASPSELMTAREMFEPALVKLVVLNATDGDIRKLRDLVEQQKNAGPALEFEAGDIALHRAIAAAARRNSDWRKLKATVARRKPERRLQAIVEHERIIQALENRDADEAGAAMRSHLASVRYNLIDTQY